MRRALFPWRLNAYVVRLSAVIAAMTWLGLTAIYAAVDFVELANQGGQAPGLLAYAGRFPLIASHTLAIACLLGVVLGHAILEGRQEWTAMVGAGIAPRGIAASFWILCVSAALVGLCLGGTLAPRGLRAYLSTAGTGPHPLIRARDASGGFWHAVPCGADRLCDVTFRSPQRPSEGPERMYASRMIRTGAGWTFHDVWVWRVAQRPEFHRTLGAPPVPDALFLRHMSDPRLETSAALASRMRDPGAIPGLKAACSSELDLRRAIALASLALPMLGLAVARRLSPRPSLVLRAGASLVAAGLYWILLVMISIAARAGQMPSGALGFGLPAVFLVGSVVSLISRERTRGRQTVLHRIYQGSKSQSPCGWIARDSRDRP